MNPHSSSTHRGSATNSHCSEERPRIPFTKMEGLGNDYIYIDRFSHKTEHDWPALSRRMSDRHFGVGADGIILIEPGETQPFRMRIFNADGSEGDMCGNGMRCFARYVHGHRLAKDNTLLVETRAGSIMSVIRVQDGCVVNVSVDMGTPIFGRKDIPLTRLTGPEPAVDEAVEVDGETLRGTALFMGGPHFVVFVDDVGEVDLARLGPKLENHELFSSRANISFVSVKAPESLHMRVWERGSGATLACGTGACAAVVAAALSGRVRYAAQVTVDLPGGALRVEWKSDGHVWQTGPADEVFSGVYFDSGD